MTDGNNVTNNQGSQSNEIQSSSSREQIHIPTAQNSTVKKGDDSVYTDIEIKKER